MSYTRPVYPYMRNLKIKIRIFKLKNEEYKLKYKEESGLTFNNYYFNNYYNDLIKNIKAKPETSLVSGFALSGIREFKYSTTLLSQRHSS